MSRIYENDEVVKTTRDISIWNGTDRTSVRRAEILDTETGNWILDLSVNSPGYSINYYDEQDRFTKKEDYKLVDGEFELQYLREYSYEEIAENGSSTFINTEIQSEYSETEKKLMKKSRQVSVNDELSPLSEKSDFYYVNGKWVLSYYTSYFEQKKNYEENINVWKIFYYYNDNGCPEKKYDFGYDDVKQEFILNSETIFEYNDTLLQNGTEIHYDGKDTISATYLTNDYTDDFLNMSSYQRIYFTENDYNFIKTNEYFLIDKYHIKARILNSYQNDSNIFYLYDLDYKLNEDGLVIEILGTSYKIEIENGINDTTQIDRYKHIYYPKAKDPASISHKVEKLEIHPNPAGDFLMINDTEPANYRIIDINGQIVFVAKNISQQLNIETLKPGMYILMKEKNDRYFNQKFIKQ